eukprot:3645847-Prymnesium_polylepis.1
MHAQVPGAPLPPPCVRWCGARPQGGSFAGTGCTDHKISIACIANVLEVTVHRNLRLPQVLQPVVFVQGDYIIQEGDAADAMYFISTGK